MSFTVDIKLNCDECGFLLAERRGLVGVDTVIDARRDMELRLKGDQLLFTKIIRRRTIHICHHCAPLLRR